MDLNYVEKPLKTIDDSIKILGTLGMDFISKHKITINYKENYMIIDSNEENKGRKYNLEFSSKKHPLVKVEIDNNLHTQLDTDESNCVCDNNYSDIFIKEVIEDIGEQLLPFKVKGLEVILLRMLKYMLKIWILNRFG